MKKVVLVSLLILLIAIGLLALTFTADVIETGQSPSIDVPLNTSPTAMSMITLSSGSMESKAGFAYRGGDFSELRELVMGSALIKHPDGILLIDAGFARDVDAHFETTTALMQRTSKINKEQPVADQLAAYNLQVSDLDAVILTHAHWDHVSGLADLPNVPVWVTQEELKFAESQSDHTIVARLIGTDTYQSYQFNDGPFLGFEQSYDVFGDKAIVIVPASGHTPGSVIVFVTLPNGQRYAFIGDLAWQQEGIDIPAEKPWLARTLLDEDRESVRRLLVHMHHLQKQVDNLTVVPAHDQRVWASLAESR